MTSRMRPASTGPPSSQIFFRVIMPLALPAVGVIGIFAALHAWNDFLGPLIYLQEEAKYTLAIGLNFFRSAHDIQFNLLMAAYHAHGAAGDRLSSSSFSGRWSKGSRWGASSSRALHPLAPAPDPRLQMAWIR